MKLTSFKSLLLALGFVASLITVTGCNKGYGCPTDFSVDAAIEVPAAVLADC